MIPVLKIQHVDPDTGELKGTDGFVKAKGNPTLWRLDMQAKAPLQTVLSESWTPEQRAAYGVHMAEPSTIPDGHEVTGEAYYELWPDGVVREAIPTQPVEPPSEAEMLQAVERYAQDKFGLGPDELHALLGG